MSTLAQRMTQAFQHHQANRLADAEALYRGILREAPQTAHVLHMLGILVHQTGRHAEAIDLISRALKVHGAHPQFHSNLSSVYLATDNLSQAESHARQALRLDAALPDAHNNLGVALRRQGRLDQAEVAFREAVRLAPKHIDARCNLGAVLQSQGKLPEALARLEEAVRLAPNHAQAHNDLGGAFLASSQPERAAQHLREAIRLRPAFVQAYSNLGLALRDMRQIDESMQSFREALRLDPSNAVARNNMAYTLEMVGRLDESLTEFQEVLRLDPGNSMALVSIGKFASAGHHRLTDDYDQNLRTLAARQDMPPEDRCRLHFALGAQLDTLGDCDSAFDHYRRGNESRLELDRLRGTVFDPVGHRKLVDRLIATFTPSYFERVRSFGVDSKLPVFIVGMMRSGTTLAEQILASHPLVFGAGELEDIEKLTQTLSNRMGASYPECLAGLDAATSKDLAGLYLDRLLQMGGATERVVDKMPSNFLYLGLIATLFPRAALIHCQRNAIDTCLSCFFQNFGNPHPFASDLRTLGQYYREYRRLMAHWASVLPVPLFDLHYEELTATQEATSRRLVAFCGLDWDERCLHFEETRRVVRTASVLQVRQPMYRSSVGRWKRYERHLGPLLEELGEG